MTILKPNSLSDALAKLVEDKLRDTQPMQSKFSPPWRPFGVHTGNHPNPPPNTLPPLLQLPAPTNHKTQLPIRRLTTAEAQERRAQGLCYNCDERLTVEPEPEISFRALVGSLGPRCFTMLIDTGNGEKIQSEGTCRNISFDMQGANFEADFHILEFSDADTILGVQWLEGTGRS
nr:Ty3/gypsy retrotransposon protein [Ipomoea batatas]